jgi:hypothetical protein
MPAVMFFIFVHFPLSCLDSFKMPELTAAVKARHG